MLCYATSIAKDTKTMMKPLKEGFSRPSIRIAFMVALSLCSATNLHAVPYSFTSISFPALSFGQTTSANGINDHGDIVGYYQCAHGPCAYLLTGRNFSTLQTPGTASAATGINNSGDIVGFYNQYVDAVTPQDYGFLISGGLTTSILFPGSSSTWAYDINDLGQIVGGYRLNGQVHGFLLVNGIFSTIDFPGSSFTMPGAINNSGLISGHINGPTVAAGFLFDGTTYSSFTGPGGQNVGDVGGINDAGTIVGSYDQPQAPQWQNGFVLTGLGGLSSLSYPGAVQTQLYGINNLGEVVGQYRDSNGDYFGFLAAPQSQSLPETSSVLLLGVGALGLVSCLKILRTARLTA
jgi:probable HAF family extracellular repeat protein